MTTRISEVERAARSREFNQLYERAADAGVAAGDAAGAPEVGWVDRMSGERFSAPISGTAYVKIRPANHPFVRWMQSQNMRGFTAHTGGWQFAIRRYGQAFEPSMAYATAFAAVLREAGIKAYTDSWVN